MSSTRALTSLIFSSSSIRKTFAGDPPGTRAKQFLFFEIRKKPFVHLENLHHLSDCPESLSMFKAKCSMRGLRQ